jgi:hypothetical protein
MREFAHVSTALSCRLFLTSKKVTIKRSLRDQCARRYASCGPAFFYFRAWRVDRDNARGIIVSSRCQER